MWIINRRCGICVNARYVIRIFIQDTPDSALVSAVLSGDDRLCVLERYCNHKEAMDAIAQVYWAMGEDRDVIEMPDSTYYYYEREIKDARTKRKGGS